MSMRLLAAALVTLLVLVHGALWFGKSGVPRVFELEGKLRTQDVANDAARARNAQVLAEVDDLRNGLEIVEEKARAELGMLKPDEVLIQVTPAR